MTRAGPIGLIFDQVRVGGDLLSAERFSALSAFRRVEYIPSDEIDFLRDGQSVDRREALNALRAHNARSA